MFENESANRLDRNNFQLKNLPSINQRNLNHETRRGPQKLVAGAALWAACSKSYQFKPKRFCNNLNKAGMQVLMHQLMEKKAVLHLD